tara:strand:+ start:117 stop:623 length:507 start_codon:yes stop_codon:yes gene_type:complete
MKEDRGYYRLKKEIGEVKDLVQELMRRLGNLELRGTVQYGQPNHISQQSVQFNLKSQRTINGKLVGDIEMEEKNRWDRLKEIKLDTPKKAVKLNKEDKKTFNDEVKEVIKKDKRFNQIDELEWLNLSSLITSGLDAFQNGDFKDSKVREQVSGVLLSRIKKWIEERNV